MSSQPDKLTCGNGHSFAVPADAMPEEPVACPDCGEEVSIDAPVGHRSGSKGRSLWSVMSRGEPGEGEKQAASVEAVTENDSTAAQDSSDVASAEDSIPAPKSLWAVVESAEGDSDDSAAATGAAATGDHASPESAQQPVPDSADSVADDPSDSEKPRGLWATMGKQEAPAEVSDDSSEMFAEATDSVLLEAATAENPADSPRAKAAEKSDEGESLEELLAGDGEFEVREQARIRVAPKPDDSTERDVEADDEQDEISDEDDLLDDDEHEEDGWEVEEFDEGDEESVAATSLVGPSIQVPLATDPATFPGAKPAKLALGFGVAAFLFAGLNLLPEFWMKIPSTFAGLGALIFGYLSLNEGKRSPDRGKLRAIAGSGVTLGLIGMFSGPLVLNALGDGWREEQLRNAITKNLDDIGEGVEVFYEHHGAFPRATYTVDGNVDVPMHSWMSALLPHMGYEQVALEIDRKKPFDDPANFGAMSQVIPTYLVPNVDHKPTLRGLATAHFAGVGGETLTDAGRVDVGVFSRGMTVTREVLSDGASQTMLAGEITRALPAWGEPGNWRTIGRGLNRQVSGFGNAAGTGAHFLMADGSVKFFPNSTSRDVLVRLSTRNGDDPVSVPE